MKVSILYWRYNIPKECSVFDFRRLSENQKKIYLCVLCVFAVNKETAKDARKNYFHRKTQRPQRIFIFILIAETPIKINHHALRATLNIPLLEIGF